MFSPTQIVTEDRAGQTRVYDRSQPNHEPEVVPGKDGAPATAAPIPVELGVASGGMIQIRADVQVGTQSGGSRERAPLELSSGSACKGSKASRRAKRW